MVGHKRLDDNPYLIPDDVSDFCQGYMQAVREEDGWWVEIRPGGGRGPKHYRSPEAMRESLAAGIEGDAYTVAKTGLIQELTDAARAERGLPSEPVWEE